MLKSVAKMALKYTNPNKEELKYINFILNLSKKDWEKLVNNIPNEIIEKDPKEFYKLELLEKFKEILVKNN